MKLYVLSLGAGLLVGIVYSLLQVRSPAPPLVALVGCSASCSASRSSRSASNCSAVARSPRPATRRVRSAMCWGNYRVGIASTRPLARRKRKRVERYIIE